MPNEKTPIVIETLGDLLDHGYGLSAACRACGRHGRVDVAGAAERLGRSRSYVGGRLPLGCGACGSRDVSLAVLAPGTWWA